MTNNDLFSKMLHLTRLGKDRELLIEIFKLGGNFGVTRSKIDGWRRSIDHKRATVMTDLTIKQFFDGLFTYRDMMKKEHNIEVFNFTNVNLD